VLPAWATVVLTLGTALITGLVAIAVPFIQERLRTKREAAEARAAQRRKGLELAVNVRSVAEQANLDNYILNTSREHYRHLQHLGRLLEKAHDPLIALAAEDTDETLLVDAREVFGAVRGSIHATALCVEEMVKGRAPSDMFVDAARTRNPEALEKVDALIARFRPATIENGARGGGAEPDSDRGR
jgi:hypothetical protein